MVIPILVLHPILMIQIARQMKFCSICRPIAHCYSYKKFVESA